MKMDFDLLRKIMLVVESQPAGKTIQAGDLLEVIDVCPKELAAATEYLIDKEHLKGHVSWGSQGAFGSVIIKGLTSQGHDFIEVARNESVWNEVKAKAPLMTLSHLFGALVAAGGKSLGGG